MKTVLLMRHATAGDARYSQTDYDRSLTEEGLDTAKKTGLLLKSLGILPQAIIFSSAIRTQQTAMAVQEMCSPDARLISLDSLYQASAEAFAQSVRRLCIEQEACVLVVGHNPGIAGLMCQWSGLSLAVPPATVAIYQSPVEHWAEFRNTQGNQTTLVGLIQEARVLRQDVSFTGSVSG